MPFFSIYPKWRQQVAKTYLDLTNTVLRDVNEVPLTSSNFGVTRGFQSFVKESVNRSLLDIINYNDEWPWLMNVPLTSASPHTNTFTAVYQQAEYVIPDTVDNIDWDTFIIKTTDSTTGETVTEDLQYVDYSFVHNAVQGEFRKPTYVYRNLNDKNIGLYPVPDDEDTYDISYISWQHPVLLSNPTDEIPFDERWYPVLVARARYYVWLFRENTQQAQIALQEYDRNIKMMYKKYMLPDFDGMRAI